MENTIPFRVLAFMALAVCIVVAAAGAQEAGAKKPPKDKKTNNGVSSINSIAAWGMNEAGQLGNGTKTDSNTPVPVSILAEADVKALAAGEIHSLALKRDGTVWAWGGNSFGQLGDGTSGDKLTPTQVKDPNDPTGFLTGVQDIDAGQWNSYALKDDGTVVAWGSGPLGNGTDDDSGVPINVKDPSGDDDLDGVEDITAGNEHALALKDDGTVLAWGSAPLGDRTEENSNTPVEVYRLGGVEDIAAGNTHSLALKADGTVWAWGINNDGQLGYETAPDATGEPGPGLEPAQVANKDGTPLNGVKQISGGSRAVLRDNQGNPQQNFGGFSLALKIDGTVVAWGNNDHGALGDGTTTSSMAPVKVLALSRVKALDAGGGFGLALTTSGKVLGWGANEHGELGIGTYASSSTPVPISGLSGVIAISAGRTLGDHVHSLAG